MWLTDPTVLGRRVVPWFVENVIAGVDQGPQITVETNREGYFEIDCLTDRDYRLRAMHPTTVEQLIAVSDAGLIMPPQSTWFEPKLRSGLFVHELD